MLLTLPFSKHDAELAIRLAKFLKFAGSCEKHEILLSCAEDVVPVRDTIYDLIDPLFSRVHLFTQVNPRVGWPQGCNSLFLATANHIESSIPCKAWYFFEPDCLPMCSGWLDRLEDEYDRYCGPQRPFMGVIYPTFLTPANGQTFQQGTHMVGTGVYPRNLSDYVDILYALNNATWAFDVVLQNYIVPKAHHTQLIQHRWSTGKYKRDKKTGKVSGENTGNGWLPAEPLRDDAVVVHGCKDESLMQIVRGTLSAKGVPATKRKAVREKPPEIKQAQLAVAQGQVWSN